MEKLVSKITVLEDGDLLCIVQGKDVSLQPMLEVDAYDENQRLVIRDKYNNTVRVSTSIQEIDGVSFSGTYADLSTAIRDMISVANGRWNGEGTGGGQTGAAATLQVIKNDDYPSSSDYLTIGNEGTQSVDLTADCIIISSINNADFYDAASGAIQLTEGKTYEVEITFRMQPTSDQNNIAFALRRVSDNSTFAKAGCAVSKVFANPYSCEWPPFIATAAHASNGIKVRLSDFRGGTGARLYNINITIKEY